MFSWVVKVCDVQWAGVVLNLSKVVAKMLIARQNDSSILGVPFHLGTEGRGRLPRRLFDHRMLTGFRLRLPTTSASN